MNEIHTAKIKHFCLFLLILLSTSSILYAQRYNFSGYIKDKKSGEALVGATIWEAKTNIGTAGNEYGYFSMQLSKGKHNLLISHIGHETKSINIVLNNDTFVNIYLSTKINEINEIEIRANSLSRQIETPQASMHVLDNKEISNLSPQLMGEIDILKALATLPGIQGGREGSTQLSVRGGDPGQNLILLDGVPIYYTSHLLGFMSVFNNDAIKQTDVYKGGFPARYAGRLSSVIDIRMKEGNTQKRKQILDIGLLSTKLTFEGPLNKRSSYIISGRLSPVSYLARIGQKLLNASTRNNYNLYDISTKINYAINPKNKLFFSLYSGGDFFSSEIKTDSGSIGVNNLNFKLNWGNHIALLRLNHIINDKIFTNTALALSNYKFQSEQNYKGKDVKDSETFRYSGTQAYNSSIEQVELRWNLFTVLSPNYNIRLGTHANFQKFIPNAIQVNKNGLSSQDTIYNNSNIKDYNIDAFMENVFKIGNHLNSNIGLHYNQYFVDDTTFLSIEPRVNLNFIINSKFSIKISYARMQQNLHLLGNSSFGLPTDIWVPATKKVIPEKSDQYALSINTILKNNILITNEFYYKKLYDLTDFKAGTNFVRDGPETNLQEEANKDWQNRTLNGKGDAYGWELFVQKKSGKLKMSFSYSLSWSWRNFKELNYGKPYPYRYARRHKINLNVNYQIKNNIRFNMNWVYSSGFYISVPLLKYPGLYFDSPYLPYSSTYETSDSLLSEINLDANAAKNNYATPAYHRLDIGFSFIKKKKNGGTRTWNLGVYNLYNRQNPFNVFVSGRYSKRIEQLTLFPILPSISYRYEF